MATAACPLDILLMKENIGSLALREESPVLPSTDTVHVVHNGAEAMDVLGHKKMIAGLPDAILLDVLPHMENEPLIELLRSDPALMFVPTAIFSHPETEDDPMIRYTLHITCGIGNPQDPECFKTLAQAIEDFWISVTDLQCFSTETSHDHLRTHK